MDNERYQVCVFTGTRAEYGLLREVLFRLKNNNEIDLKLVVTGTHLISCFGNTQDEIIKDGFEDFIKIEIPLDDDTKKGMAVSTGIAIQKYAECLQKLSPELVVVLGDRFEILAAAIASHFMGIPVAHISGGDVTEGAIDDAIRHSITKMSSLHFPGCKQSAKRIVQMGEQPESVFDVGEPGVENCLKLELLSRDDLARNLDFDSIMNDYCVVTYHPVTMEKDTAAEQVYELISAMDAIPNMSYIITMANADAGGRSINKIWQEEGKKRSNWLVVSSLGVIRYLSAMKYSKVVIGNSSSGIVEAPSMKKPTVNIGDRQKGRMYAESVISCNPQKNEIVSAIKEALSNEMREKMKNVNSPYGDGTTSENIERILLDFLRGEKKDKKSFFDITFDD